MMLYTTAEHRHSDSSDVHPHDPKWPQCHLYKLSVNFSTCERHWWTAPVTIDVFRAGSHQTTPDFWEFPTFYNLCKIFFTPDRINSPKPRKHWKFILQLLLKFWLRQTLFSSWLTLTGRADIHHRKITFFLSGESFLCRRGWALSVFSHCVSH